MKAFVCDLNFLCKSDSVDSWLLAAAFSPSEGLIKVMKKRVLFVTI
jgi:hypothetical protein